MQSALYFYFGHDVLVKGNRKMGAKLWVLHCLAILPILAGWSAGSPLSSADNRKHARAQITVLYDAFGEHTAMHKDWGYAALVEYGGQRILFDTGNNPNILARNARAKGVDLAELDFVVMSHRRPNWSADSASHQWRPAAYFGSWLARLAASSTAAITRPPRL